MHTKVCETLGSWWVLRTCRSWVLTERSESPLRTGFVPEEAKFRLGFERKLVDFEVSFRILLNSDSQGFWPFTLLKFIKGPRIFVYYQAKN